MKLCSDNRGGVMVVVAICLLMFLVTAALVVDLGQGLSVKTQLQEVADAAALAGASQLCRDSRVIRHVFLMPEVILLVIWVLA